MSNVLAALPKSARPGTRSRPWPRLSNTKTNSRQRKTAKAFAAELGAKWPKAAAKITDDLDVLLALYDFPAGHWVHLRTTNPVESTFTTVPVRRPGHQRPQQAPTRPVLRWRSKLIESAQRR